MSDFPLILASTSPRRRQLLSEAGYEFTVVPPSEAAERVSECDAGLPAQELVAKLAVQKAKDVARQTERGIVIACDTVAACQGEILGKPGGRDDARRMLKLLRGQEHRVYSGLCVWRRPDDEQRLQIEATKLVMDAISDAELEQYLDNGQWEGKAGAFGYQDGLDWVHVVEGSESNVVGLPMELLTELLAALKRTG
jgi:nucleoside triphosphate pyrophosphatase